MIEIAENGNETKENIIKASNHQLIQKKIS